jgi:probable rRNA maturation factor
MTAPGPTIVNRQRRVAVSIARLASSTRRALAAVGRPQGDVEILVVDDTEIARMNGRFLGVAAPTDVLAFPLEASTSAEGLLGQVVISADTAQRQARRLGVPLALEMDLLATHAILHLVGYDDRDPLEAAVMHRREREILGTGVRVPARLWKGLLP